MSRFINKIDGESEEHYNLFIQYYFMGSSRSINILSQDTLISKRHLFRLAKKYKWKERIEKDIEQNNLKLKAEFAQKQKADLQRKITLMNETYERALEVAEKLNYKAEQFLSPKIDPETYLKRTNQYFSILLKIQKFEKNFQDQIENYELEESVELEDIEEELEKFGDNEKSLEMLKKSYEKMHKDDQSIDNNKDTKLDESKRKLNLPDKSDKKCHEINGDNKRLKYEINPEFEKDEDINSIRERMHLPV